LQGSNGKTDIENRLMDIRERGGEDETNNIVKQLSFN